MIPKKSELLLTAIKNQNNYKYNNILEAKSQKNNQINTDEIKKIKLEKIDTNINYKNKILHSEFDSKNPLNSVEYDSKPLKPIMINDIYNYNNIYNFDRKKIINQNEKNRMRTNKSMDLKLSIYTLNKKIYMDKIKNLFNKRNALNKKKTQMILEYKKVSNDELRQSINNKQAKQYNNYINYLKMRSLEIRKYNDMLNNRRIFVKNKFNRYNK